MSVGVRVYRTGRWLHHVSRSDAPAQGCRGTRGAKQKKDPCVAAQGPLQSLVLGARCPARVL